MTHGAIKASTVSPAIRVWVPQLPKGASIVSRSPRGAHPRKRVRFVLTAVSSVARQCIAQQCHEREENNTFGHTRYGGRAMRERVVAPLSHIGAVAFGGDQ